MMPNTLGQYWKHKGHIFGQNLSLSGSDLMYVNIPKNASTWTDRVFKELGWEVFNYFIDDCRHKKAIVILRDPVDRWLSGIAEYFTLYHPTLKVDKLSNPALDLIFDRVSFDDHTEKQIYFIEGLDLNNCVFFKFGREYRQFITHFLRSQGYDPDLRNKDIENSTSDNKEKLFIRNWFSQLVQSNQSYLNKLHNHFAEDYELINSIKFYEST